MEVFIRDEETKWDISYSLADSNNSLDCKDHKPIIVKSLDQHDAEVKKQVVEELREWYYKKLLEVRQKDKIQSEDKGSEEEMARLYALFLGRYNILGDLKKKLSEMKGEIK